MRALAAASLLVGLGCAPAAAATLYPLEVENCGFTIRLDKAPQRIVTLKSTTTELILSLGLEQRIVGVGFQDGPLPPELEPKGADLVVLSDKLPAQEVVLEVEPDLVFGGWESNFAADGAGDRATLAALGVASYVSPAACRSVKPPKLSFDHVFAEIEQMGAILDAGEAAASLVAAQRQSLAALVPNGGNRTALWYSSGTKVPYVGAGAGAPAMILEALELRNIFADVDDGWISASWEAIVDAGPDIIVLVDAAWNSAEQKKRLLAENPITSQLEAVRNERYLVIPFPASEPGVRNVPAVLDLAGQLAALPLPGP